ncbi:delta-lactam-biosynthetic de-N-acetylase [Salirhabdus salicampi]|uniref:delta-lactam-biosynthetic de-N-acetylase n=1 Tax=Salirhabdus salicampi TaxID=476102 RepID=UPI0020C32469|nr:delta-lactam-biosynthetic de-N-acetylase [Salirhabdus salicampi]MCP8617918.1 delta-lactam-biosynthetic de-N-acetylase [Salirhabdus salicampi]
MLNKLKVISFLISVLFYSVSPSTNIHALALDHTTFGWGYKKNTEHNPPDAGKYAPLLEEYGGFYVDKSGEKVVYLTFDMGYEAGYTSDILDILKEHKVPAAFFLAGHYIDSQPKLLKRMKNEGHIIGNHSWTHRDFTTLSEGKIKEDLERIEKGVEKVLGDGDLKYVRPPRGDFSERTLAITSKLGYVNIFWSSALVDWGGRNSGWQAAFRNVMDHIHPGAIILLHATSKANAEALEHLIQELRKDGYEFKSLDYLLWKETVEPPFNF